MKPVALGALIAGLLVACGGDDGGKIKVDGGADAMTGCDPLKQTGCAPGEKCSWIVDAVMPQYVGHTGCVPDGTAKVGEDCMYGAAGGTGYDNCVKGTVCSAYKGGTGKCKQICDHQGGMPACDSLHVCVTYVGLFRTAGSPPTAGVCDRACDPLEDNDFDGSGSNSVKRKNTCGDDPKVGCYGWPSFGTPPKSAFSCTNDVNYDTEVPNGLRHRAPCTTATECAEGDDIFVNSCNQGYLAVVEESSLSSTRVCVAMCKPLTCHSGDCGPNGIKRHGQSPDACVDSDRMAAVGKSLADGSDEPSGGEHCHHLWWFERSQQGQLLLSDFSDSLGICYNHEYYTYDHDNDTNTPPRPLPNCATLGATPQPGVLDAVDLGCVPTSFLPNGANGKKVLPPDFVEQQRKLNVPRPLYGRMMSIR